MAIRDDINMMLNSLKDGGTPVKKPKNSNNGNNPIKAPAPRKTVYDTMSVDDLLSELTKNKSVSKQTVSPVLIPEKKNESKQIHSEQKINTSVNATKKTQEPTKNNKKRIIINNELPDYEAIRRKELMKAEEEARKKAAEEAEAKKRAEDEARKKAAEEAEAKKRAEDEARKKAAEEAEAKKRAEDEARKKAAEEAEAKKRAEDEARKKAAEEAEAKKRAENEAEIKKPTEEEKKKKSSKESKAKRRAEKEAKKKTAATDKDSEGNDSIKTNMQNATDLIDAAIAAIEEVQLEISENNPNDSNSDNSDNPKSDKQSDSTENTTDISQMPLGSYENTNPDKELISDSAIDIIVETELKPKNKIIDTLEKILNEDSKEITSERSEKSEQDNIDVSLEKKNTRNFKKHLYTILGIIFTILAVIGLITITQNGILFFRSFTAGETKMEVFTDIVYPAVIIDIDSFETPSELSSEQIITTALWSLVMSEEKMSKYEETFDVISVPAIDIEAYAAKIFGSGLNNLEHGTVGSGELKFYYNEETKAYNVPVNPITFTYKPSIKSVAKNGNNYTVEVNYISELPSWMKKFEKNDDSIAKTVEFRLEENNGQYTISSMKVISVNSKL